MQAVALISCHSCQSPGFSSWEAAVPFAIRKGHTSKHRRQRGRKSKLRDLAWTHSAKAGTEREHAGVLTNYAHLQMHVHTHSQTRPGNSTLTDMHGHMGLYAHLLLLCIVFIFMISESHFVLLAPKLSIWEKNVGGRRGSEM